MKQKRRKPFAANLASRKMMEADGWTVETVEQTIPHCFIKRDFGGFADLIAFRPGPGPGNIVAIQVTAGISTSNAHERIRKIKAEPRSGIWLAAGGRIQVHSWQGRGNKRECHITNLRTFRTHET